MHLVPLSMQHLDEGFALIEASRAELMPWLPWSRGSTLDDHRGYIRGVEANRGGIDDVYALIVDERLAGSLAVHDYDPARRSAALGYWLGTPFTGRGLMTAAVRSIVVTLFDDARLNRIEIYAATGNERSCRVAQHAGFARDALLRAHLALGEERVDAYRFVRERD